MKKTKLLLSNASLTTVEHTWVMQKMRSIKIAKIHNAVEYPKFLP